MEHRVQYTQHGKPTFSSSSRNNLKSKFQALNLNDKEQADMEPIIIIKHRSKPKPSTISNTKSNANPKESNANPKINPSLLLPLAQTPAADYRIPKSYDLRLSASETKASLISSACPHLNREIVILYKKDHPFCLSAGCRCLRNGWAPRWPWEWEWRWEDGVAMQGLLRVERHR